MKLMLYISIMFLSSNQSFGGDIECTFFPNTDREQSVEGAWGTAKPGEKFVADSKNRYDVYDYIMSEFRKDDFKPIISAVTNYTTEQKMRVDFTVGCRDGEYIVMGIKPDAHVLVWENPNESPDTCISDIE